MSRKKITEVAEVERAVKGKVYPAGCTLIALSATKPEPEYAPDSGEICRNHAEKDRTGISVRGCEVGVAGVLA